VTAFVALATAGLGLLLAASGVYSLLAWLLSQRTREFGIRSALGASRRDLRGMVLRQAVVLAGLGLAIGLPTAVAAARWTAAALPELAAWDPGSLAVAAVVLASAGIAAALGPARRVGRIDPIAALRSE
jgi:ABC-type antimicrobial peptide transport system permease subunit